MRKIVPFQFRSREDEMGQSIASYAERMVKEAAEPVLPGEKIKAQINRACSALGYPMGHWRIRAAWNREADCWSARALRELEDRYQSWRVRQKKKADMEAAKAAAVFTALAQQLERTDAAYHCEDITALLRVARQLGGASDEQMN